MVFKDFYLNIKLEENGIMPTRAHSSDAGLDFYSPGDYEIKPNGDILIPLQLRTEFPEGYALIFKEKSGVATKKHVSVGACVSNNTYIKTNKGIFSVLDLNSEFIKNNEIQILSYNRDLNKFEYKNFDGFRPTGEKKVYKITFEDDSFIEVSEDHKLLTEDNLYVSIEQYLNKEENINFDFKVL